MQASDLKNLKKLRSEKKGLELLIREISGETVEDVVTGSSPYFPYGKHKIIVRGVNEKRLHSLRIQLIKKKQELEKAIEEAEAYLETVEDPVDRNILRLRCEMGLEWKEVAERCGSTENACKVRFHRLTKKLEQEESCNTCNV